MSKYINQDQEILHGKPVLAGTRIPVARILYLLKQGFTLEAIHDQYPHVPLKKLQGAIDEVISAIESKNASLL